MYRNIDLLDFDGQESDDRGFGVSVVKKIFPTAEERSLYCFSPRKNHENVRQRAPKEAEKAFKGI